MDDTTLQQALNALAQSGPQSNPAYTTLLADYTLYHAVLAIEGGVFATLLALLCWRCWRRSRQIYPTDAPRRTFERNVYRGFGVASAAVMLGLLLIVAANLSNALNPQAGFAQAIPDLGAPQAGTPQAALHRDVASWAQSGAAAMPATLREAVRSRLAWQLPKAIVSSILLVAIAALTVLLWRAIIRRAADAARWGPRIYAGMGLGALSASATLLLMLMALANTQASLAPITITLLFG